MMDNMENIEKSPGKITQKLDSWFKISERSSTVGSEIKAGLGAFCIAVCALLVNAQVIGTTYGNYAGAYLAVSFIAFAGTLLLGVLCNLPMLQTANMGISSVLISMMGSNTGLTYANLMFVTFIAAIIYLIIVVTPLKKVFIDALPEGVKKAMPVAIGLYVIYTALKNCGLLTDAGTINNASGLTNLDLFYFWLLIAGIVLVVIYTAAKRRNALGSTYFMLILAMWVGGVVFFLEYFVGGQTATTLVYQRLNLIVATDGASPYNIATGISSLKIGALFKKGLDFSAFTEAGGNVALFMIESVLTFLFIGMYTNLGNYKASVVAGGFDEQEWVTESEKKALIVGAALNVVSPVFGGTPTSIGAQSAIETKDGGKTGLSSLAAAVGFFIAMFNWVFFATFATSTNGVGMWINDTETKLAAYVQDGFVFADLIMVFAGIAMLKGITKIDVKNLEEMVPFAATLIGAAVFGDLVIGIGFAAVLYCIAKLIGKDRKEISPATIILAVILIVYVFIALKYGGNFITATAGGPGMGGGAGGPAPQ